MMHPETLKILLVIAMGNPPMAAYLQALLYYDVYVSDINEKEEVEYWKLNKALYGLKQPCSFHFLFPSIIFCSLVIAQFHYIALK